MAKKTLFKLLSLLSDRRLLLYVFTLGLSFAAFPLLAQIVAVVGGSWLLLWSWTTRPPSGLDFDKIIYDRTGELARLLRELGIDEG